MLPDADYLYACDLRWWQIHIEDVKKTFKGKLVTQYERDHEKEFAESNGILALKGLHKGGLGREQLHYGSNSGYQAINLAYLHGATHIVLLGFDMGATGNTHWFGDHKHGLANGNYTSFVDRFTALAEDLKSEGVQVTNCTRKTNLWQFEKMSIDDYPHFHSVQ